MIGRTWDCLVANSDDTQAPAMLLVNRYHLLSRNQYMHGRYFLKRAHKQDHTQAGFSSCISILRHDSHMTKHQCLALRALCVLQLLGLEIGKVFEHYPSIAYHIALSLALKCIVQSTDSDSPTNWENKNMCCWWVYIVHITGITGYLEKWWALIARPGFIHGNRQTVERS